MSTIIKMLDDALKCHDQVILTGAPGTGKTYSVKKYVEGKNNVFVQFHPSYDYSDFVEGLKPVLLNMKSNDPTFVKLDGKFKKFCRDVVTKNLEKVGAKYDSLFKTTYREKVENSKEKLDIYYFIIDEINRADLSKVFGELMYLFENRGIDHAIKTQYYNLDTYCIDKDEMAVPIVNDYFKDGFFIPKNIKIIGTMNDIDKSVEAFDFALRRRFYWLNIRVDDILESTLSEIFNEKKETNDIFADLISRIKNLNNYIATDGIDYGLNENYQIGPSYFKNLLLNADLNDNLKILFNYSIKPLLIEYTRGRNKADEFIKNCYNKLIDYESEIVDSNEEESDEELEADDSEKQENND